MGKWVILFTTILLVACSTGRVTQESPTLRIGGVFHQSGDASAWGIAETNAALLAIEDWQKEHPDQKIKFVVEDGATDFTKTTLALQKLTTVDKVQVIVGPTWFGQIGAPFAAENRVLIISPSAGSVPTPNSYFFNLWPTEKIEAKPVVDAMVKARISRVALITNQNDWSESNGQEFQKLAMLAGISIDYSESVPVDANDFRIELEKIRTSKAQAIYAPLAFYPQQGALSKQYKELGIKIPLYSSAGTENPHLLNSYPEIEGTMYPYPTRSEEENEFRIRYAIKYGESPGTSAAYAYDAMTLALFALTNTDGTSEKMSEYLHKTVDYRGTSNTISFDQNGRILTKDYGMKVVLDGKFVTLSN